MRYKTVNDGASKGTAGLKERATHFALIETSLKVCRPQSLTPKPQTRGPRPETRDPRPETRDPKPEARNSKPTLGCVFGRGASCLPRRNLLYLVAGLEELTTHLAAIETSLKVPPPPPHSAPV